MEIYFVRDALWIGDEMKDKHFRLGCLFLITLTWMGGNLLLGILFFPSIPFAYAFPSSIHGFNNTITPTPTLSNPGPDNSTSFLIPILTAIITAITTGVISGIFVVYQVRKN